MKKSLSIYLDLLRVLAALVVFLCHFSTQTVSGGFLWKFQQYGHPAVIVFFVLSGFLIQYSVAVRERSLLDYAVARLSRLYSVVPIALALTFVLDRIGIARFPDAYFPDDETHPLLRLISGVFFLSQSWTWVQTMFSNLPFWSLPYEAWYYAIFGAAIFLTGRKRAVAVLVCAVIAGPAILLYMPIWLCGAAAFRAAQRFRFGPGFALPLFVVTAALFSFLIANENSWFQTYNRPFLPQSVSAADYLLGPLLALNILAATRVELPLIWLGRPVKYLAGMTFTIYLLHEPVLRLVSGFFVGLPLVLRASAVASVTFFAIWLISLVTEHKRHLWNSFFRSLMAP